MDKPKLVECFADNGQHSHWELLHPDTGDLLWSEDTQRKDFELLIDLVKQEFTPIIGGRKRLLFFTSPKSIDAFAKAVCDYPMTPGEAFTCAPIDFPEPSAGIKEIIAIHKKLMDEAIRPSSEGLHPEPKKKTYQEPPWKFNKPHNHTSEPYGKSNRSCRTARKRKNKRN